jgi:hypothetical protein
MMPEDKLVTIQIHESKYQYIVEKLAEIATEDKYQNNLYLLNIIQQMEKSKMFFQRRETGYR